MGLVKTRRLMAMQKQQRAKAGMKPPVKKGGALPPHLYKSGGKPAADLPRGGGGGGQPPSAIGLRESIQSGRSFNTSSTAPYPSRPRGAFQVGARHKGTALPGQIRATRVRRHSSE